MYFDGCGKAEHIPFWAKRLYAASSTLERYFKWVMEHRVDYNPCSFSESYRVLEFVDGCSVTSHSLKILSS
jgi:hypothetical protein